MTDISKEAVERVAMAIKNADASFFSWDQTTPVEREIYRNTARAALSALPPQEVGVQDMPETEIGDIGNYYGGLLIRCVNGSPEWRIENYDGMNWDRCDPHVFAALRALSENPHE